jgi:hypothetical protein
MYFWGHPLKVGSSVWGQTPVKSFFEGLTMSPFNWINLERWDRLDR